MPTDRAAELTQFTEAFDDMTLHRAFLAGFHADALDGPGGAMRDALWPAFVRAHDALAGPLRAELQAARLEVVRLTRALAAARAKSP